MKTILVTGGNGQLASCLKKAVVHAAEYHWVFKSAKELDISKADKIAAIFEEIQPHFCINCAGYTEVDLAETEFQKAKRVNVEGARILAAASAKFKVKLIHISTDFVFDGNSSKPYVEEDETNPLGVYGQTKRDGELAIIKELDAHYIIRTSWLYSEFGNNFMKTMLGLADEGVAVKVVDDQIGAPTYAFDLAICILKIIRKNNTAYGLYHFSNSGQTSWFGFAEKIFELVKMNVHITPIKSSSYPTKAKRPVYSVLNSTKIKNTFDLKISFWQDSLERCIQNINLKTS